MSIGEIHNNLVKPKVEEKKTQVQEENKSEKDNSIFQKQEERAYKAEEIKEAEELVSQAKIKRQQMELYKYGKSLDRTAGESLEEYSTRLETLLNECEELAKATGYSGRKFEPKFEL